jgi:hypothetical protein
MPLRRSMLAGVAGQKPRRRQLVRIAHPHANDAVESWPRVSVGSLYPDLGDHPALPSGLRRRPAQRSAGASDDAVRACAPAQRCVFILATRERRVTATFADSSMTVHRSEH